MIDFHFQLLEHSFFLIVQYAKSTSLPPHPRGSSGPTYVSDTSAAFSSAQETMQLQKNEHKEFREIKKNITILKKLFAFTRLKKIYFGRKFIHKHILNVNVFRKLNKPVFFTK